MYYVLEKCQKREDVTEKLNRQPDAKERKPEQKLEGKAMHE
jgi:hypothetical protein